MLLLLISTSVIFIEKQGVIFIQKTWILPVGHTLTNIKTPNTRFWQSILSSGIHIFIATCMSSYSMNTKCSVPESINIIVLYYMYQNHSPEINIQ